MRCQRIVDYAGYEGPCDCFELVGVAVVSYAEEVPVCGPHAIDYQHEGVKIRWLPEYETPRRETSWEAEERNAMSHLGTRTPVHPDLFDAMTRRAEKAEKRIRDLRNVLYGISRSTDGIRSARDAKIALIVDDYAAGKE